MKTNRFVILVSIFTALGFLLASSVNIAAEVKRMEVRQVVVVADNDELSKDLQRELEYGNALLADPNCGADCGPIPGAKLRTPDGGSTRYTCNNGNCACSGACDCVVMDDICMPDTIGCSDYGCSCKENSDAEHNKPNCG